MSHSFFLSSKLNLNLKRKYHFVTYVEFQQQNHRHNLRTFGQSSLGTDSSPGFNSMRVRSIILSELIWIRWKRGEKDSNHGRYKQIWSIKSSENEDRCQNSHSSVQTTVENGRIATVLRQSLMNSSDIDDHQLFISIRQNVRKPSNRNSFWSYRVVTSRKIAFCLWVSGKSRRYWIRKGSNKF
jgi:hypothetical protein